MKAEKKRAHILVFSIFIVSLVYTSVKVHLLGDTELKMLPLYTVNKAFAWTGLSLLAFTFTASTLLATGRISAKWQGSRKYLGKAAFNILGLHAIWTLLLFRTEYGLAFIWEDEGIRAEGVLGIVMGSIALAFLAYYSNKAGKGGNVKFLSNMPTWILAIAMVHIGLWGISPWFNSTNWSAYLPPASLLAFITAAIGLWIRMTKK